MSRRHTTCATDQLSGYSKGAFCTLLRGLWLMLVVLQLLPVASVGGDTPASGSSPGATQRHTLPGLRSARGGAGGLVPAASPGRTVFRTRDGFTQRSRAQRQAGGCSGYASQGLKVAKDLLNLKELFMNRESCGTGECPRLSDVSLASVPQLMLPATSRQGLRPHSRWGSCALVGNSGSLLTQRDGRRIDSHDIVMRFNEAPTAGLDVHVGNKTTHRMLNHIWARGYADSKTAPSGFRLRQGYHPLEPNVTLLLNACIPARFCSLPRDFVQLRARMGFSRPDVHVLYTSKRVVGAANRLLAIYGACIYAGKRQSAPAPTTGLAAMILLLKLCRTVTLFGMGGVEGAAEYHYYDMGHGTAVKRGFRTHNFHLERFLLRDLARRGLIRVCGTDGCGT